MIKSIFKKIWGALTSFLQSIRPGKIAYKGAAKSIWLTTFIIWLICSSLFFLIDPGTWFGIIPIIVIPGITLLLGGLSVLLFPLLAKIPKPLVWVLPSAYILISFAFNQGSLGWQFPMILIICAGGAGAALFTFTKKTKLQNTIRQKVVAALGAIIGVAGLIWGTAWMLDTGFKPEVELINASLEASFRPEKIKLPNPGEPGEFKVNYLTYGSGKDKQRPEFRKDISIQTDSVDGSRLIDNWDGPSGKLRTWYWGFDEEALPLNGRVWYPEGDGPFPLALIVHGNHSMFDYSDPGYEYLGQLLASQGMIMVSVDENFINSGWTDIISDGLEEENDARGWLLLKHLEEWRDWNQDETNPFFGKVDMNNLAVMGHSRGGEAAAIAGFFNDLKYYPDNAKEEFNFGFDIKAVVSIAPVDGQYKPAEIGTPLKDLNYMVIHGSNDGDVQSFAGLRQYERLEFSDSTDFFKSAVYVYGANHGQFNSSWGNKDSPQPFASVLNLDALMPMDDQLTIGKVHISAFLQATLLGKRDYRNLLKDYRSGIDWLPETIFLNQFESSDWETLASFDEDLDLKSTDYGASVSTENLTMWREQAVGMKWGNKATRAAYIGWDSLAYPNDTAKYQFNFSEPIDLQNQVLTFEMAQSKESTYPDKERDKEKAENIDENEENNSKNNIEVENNTNETEEKEEDSEEEKAPEPINFSIKISDDLGESVVFNLNEYALLQPQLTVDIYKNKELQTNKTSEAVYQTFIFNIDELGLKNPSFNSMKVVHIEFIFDQTKKGVVILDKVARHNNDSQSYD